jgi:hypothetical protein
MNCLRSSHSLSSLIGELDRSQPREQVEDQWMCKPDVLGRKRVLDFKAQCIAY